MSTLILYNGPIYTLDPQHPVVRAVAIRDGRIVAMGSEGHVQAVTAAAGRSEGINLQGRAVVPGLTDAHVHITFQGLASQDVRLGGAASIAEAVGRVADRAGGMMPGAWLRGGGWDHSAWGGQWPARSDLDAVCPTTPVVLSRKDGHSLWANSAALAAAGITAATPDPSGGQIQRDHDGEPTGILLETAMDLLRAVVPPHSREERQAALRLALREALSYGITSIHIPTSTGPTDGRETLIDLQDLRGRGELSLRCLSTISVDDLDAAIALGLKSGLGDPWLRVGGLKIFADGSLGSESAEMLSHYEGRRHLGIATIERDVLEETVARANANGISVIIHAIGDAANRKVLDAIELARGDGPPPALAMPNRIEHCQVLHPKDVGRFAELGVIASMQPIHCTSDIETADELWGPRCSLAYAWRTLRDSGATLAFGSDAPVETMNPWAGVHAAVTRQRPGGVPQGGWHPEQCLTVAEALEAYCVGPAITSGEADIKGRVAVGMLADLAVLTGDPFRSAPGELHAITAAMTLVEGKVVFER
ncbi:amidohydrolase [Oscillochloris sp. ZM17-4]|uniref:amidohydrolase n=1 Tax=Oscillochloris sp. ZM17-4 TaxID=2866714 RepID=UPI001C737841|nr:amidohydrolase [Oscillochloris sp. ZM17-4]MBX0327106.1 amidohydrolase [Oscillochloris sp. ZM17-4]